MNTTLEEALETNRRLNRRVQGMEGPLTSLISEAQKETQRAQHETRMAFEALNYANARWTAALRDWSNDQRTLIGFAIFGAVMFLWAVTASVIAILR